MKKFLIVIGVFVLIIVLALSAFILTFDANHYKNQVAKALADSLGSPVRIGNISLGWRQGLSVEIKELLIFRDKDTLDKPAVYLERASVKARLMPLLQKKLEVVSILLVRPKFNVIREADGSIRVNGLNPRPSESQSQNSGGPSLSAQAAASFLISTVKIQGAEIGFVDRSPAMPLSLAIHRLDIVMRNLSFSSPVDFQAALAVFGKNQNIRLQGRLRITGMTGPYVLENFNADTDFGSFNFAEMTNSVPALKKAGFREPPSGKLNAAIDRLQIEAKGLSDLYSTLNLSGARVAVESLRSPLENLNIDATATENVFQLKNLSANFARGTITGSGSSKNYFSAFPQSTLGLKVDKVSLSEILPPAQPSQPQLQGNFSGAFNGEAKGFSWPVISKTLTGDGEVMLTEGRVVNVNILRFVFDKLSQIPGVAATINKQLPPHYRKLLDQHDTVLPPLNFPVKIVNGVLMIPNLKIGTEGFELLISGQLSLEGAVNCQATLMIEPELTAIIVQNAPQIQYIVDTNGRLAIPARISGDVQHLNIQPDMDYVLSRVIENKGKELIVNALQKALTKNQAPSTTAGAADNTATQDPSYQNVLGKLLQ